MVQNGNISPFLDPNASLPATTTGSSTAPAVTLSTTYANALILVGAATHSSATFTANTTGLTIPTGGTAISGSLVSAAIETGLFASPQTNLSAAFTLSATNPWDIVAIAILPILAPPQNLTINKSKSRRGVMLAALRKTKSKAWEGQKSAAAVVTTRALPAIAMRARKRLLTPLYHGKTRRFSGAKPNVASTQLPLLRRPRTKKRGTTAFPRGRTKRIAGEKPNVSSTQLPLIRKVRGKRRLTPLSRGKHTTVRAPNPILYPIAIVQVHRKKERTPLPRGKTKRISGERPPVSATQLPLLRRVRSKKRLDPIPRGKSQRARQPRIGVTIHEQQPEQMRAKKRLETFPKKKVRSVRFGPGPRTQPAIVSARVRPARVRKRLYAPPRGKIRQFGRTPRIGVTTKPAQVVSVRAKHRTTPLTRGKSKTVGRIPGRFQPGTPPQMRSTAKRKIRLSTLPKTKTPRKAGLLKPLVQAPPRPKLKKPRRGLPSKPQLKKPRLPRAPLQKLPPPPLPQRLASPVLGILEKRPFRQQFTHPPRTTAPTQIGVLIAKVTSAVGKGVVETIEGEGSAEVKTGKMHISIEEV